MSLALDQRLLREHATRDRDLILVQFALPYGPAVRLSAHRLGLAYAVHLRGDDVWIWPHTRRDSIRAFRETVKGASLVLAVSEALLQEARRLADDDLSHSVVVANGIDLTRFRPPVDSERAVARAALGIPQEAAVVLCVGTALERKGWRELLLALGSLGGSAPTLVAVTSGYGNLSVQRLRDELAPNVGLVERRDLDADALSDVYRAADLFCLPSHGEGMSNAVLEAMASGLPVVTTAVGGHPEVIEPDVDGVFVPVGESDVLADAVRLLLDDPARRARMGRLARKRAEAIGTPRDNGGRIARLFDAVLERGEIAPDLLRSAYVASTPR